MSNIEVGDIVRVDFNGAQLTLVHEAEVLNIPHATGESWIFRSLVTGSVYYVSEGCTVTKAAKT